MISKDKKKEIVAELIEKLKKTTGLYLIDYVHMTVEDAINFRRACRENGIEYRVAKNTLIKLALEEVGGFEIPAEKLTWMTGLAFGYEDPIAPSKVIKAFFDKNDKAVLKAAILEGRYYDGSRLAEITAMPSRKDLIAGIIGSLDAPLTGIVRAIEDPARGIVGALGGVVGDLAYLIEEVAKKQNAA